MTTASHDNDTPSQVTLVHPYTGVTYEFVATPGDANDGVIIVHRDAHGNVELPIRAETLATLIRITGDQPIREFFTHIFHLLRPRETSDD